jgi:hypothetical protein
LEIANEENLKTQEEIKMAEKEVTTTLQKSLFWGGLLRRSLEKVNVYLPSVRMKVPDHVYVFESLLLQ